MIKQLVSYLRTLKTATILFVAAALGFAGIAASQIYYGYNPNTGLNALPGVPVAGGVPPVLSGAGCGTLATVQASETGGAAVVQFAAQATTCTLTLTTATIAPATAPAPVLHGIFCVPVDETHVATAASQTAHTTTSCTIALTGVTVGDNILVEINGY